MTENAPLRVGDILRGFCGGSFGRDSYHDKRVEAIGGDWVIARSVSEFDAQGPEFCAGDPERLREYRLVAMRQRTLDDNSNRRPAS